MTEVEGMLSGVDEWLPESMTVEAVDRWDVWL